MTPDSTRPPNQPPTPPPPPRPTPPAPTTADIYGLAEAVGFVDLQTPARQIPTTAAAAVVSVSAPGGPAQTTRGTPGEEPTPGSGAAISSAARESGGVLPHFAAGASVPSGSGRTSGLVTIHASGDGSGAGPAITRAADVDVPAVRARDDGRAVGAGGAATYRGHDKP